jgi:hypothetical protein
LEDFNFTRKALLSFTYFGEGIESWIYFYPDPGEQRPAGSPGSIKSCTISLPGVLPWQLQTLHR